MLLIILGMSLCFVMTGCVSKRGIITNQQKANESLPAVRYKYDRNASFGQMAAIYDNNMYYCTEKESGAGIYKRSLLSGKEELIIEVENIRKIQVTEEGIYYVGRTPENDIKENYPDGQWNTYQLFFHDGHQKAEAEDILLSDKVFVWDFYVAADYIFLVTIRCGIPTGTPDLLKYLITNDGGNKGWNVDNIIMDSTEIPNSLSRQDTLVFCSRLILSDEREMVTGGMASVYDESIDELVYIASERIEYGINYRYMLITRYEGLYLYVAENEIFLINEKGIHKQKIIDFVEEIKFGVKNENIVNLIAGTEEGECLLQLNLDTFVVEKLQSLEKKEKAVAITDKGFISVTKKSIIIRDAKSGEVIHEQEWETKVNLDSDTIEMAGDYIFVYEYTEEIGIKEMQKLNW